MSEYWIRNDGDVDFADGDQGEYNHEGIVVRNVQLSIINRCEQVFNVEKKSSWGGSRSFSDDEYVDWDEFKQALAQAFADDYVQKNPQKERVIQTHLENDHDRLINLALRQAGVKKAEWDCAEGKGDARDYAMQYWGWKTFRNDNIDTWRLSRNDLMAIIGGLESIADEEGWSDKRLSRKTFTISVFSNHRHFYLTLAQMQKWLQKPQAPSQNQNPQYDYLTSQAKAQVRNIDLQNMHPAYTTRPGVNPFGDSVINSFRAFIEGSIEELRRK